ncbi:hypothetical protein CoHVHLJ_119 [Columbid alphaherpesvirus 1]|uniref:Uncharacterized protein n=1 Tax=Columbid alphaherpesvirus 1 TaxID=93386 RepID=A0A1V0M8M3_9ALPH|nr:hypothetical protein CoHVHLJ_097 [Columbid alphaherpesvirus 1]YP_009353013.1 hypothetical protein CoHVHLJ_119 [Columbid alphaherpesvirus 1]ARD71408.1 hypothetical protein CoHVHLJ_097 [Columbid alphaherpesvirus 1]ARD71430.1 hypothetical protein CoHVHLJ_119 [Columbid alphaherpesvirus 1]
MLLEVCVGNKSEIAGAVGEKHCLALTTDNRFIALKLLSVSIQVFPPRYSRFLRCILCVGILRERYKHPEPWNNIDNPFLLFTLWFANTHATVQSLLAPGITHTLALAHSACVVLCVVVLRVTRSVCLTLLRAPLSRLSRLRP